MRTTVIIKKRGKGYIYTINGPGKVPAGVRCGLTPYDAAVKAAEMMIKYAQTNPKGGDLMAPDEVLEHVPEQLRSVDEN